MNRALQQELLSEFDETDDAVKNASTALQYYGFDKLTKPASFQAIVNRNVTAKNEKSRN
jgi:hypothetical protein